MLIFLLLNLIIQRDKKLIKPSIFLFVVTILVNLAPKNLKGIMSQGMILMAEDSSGKLCFVSPTESANNGSEIK